MAFHQNLASVLASLPQRTPNMIAPAIGAAGGALPYNAARPNPTLPPSALAALMAQIQARGGAQPAALGGIGPQAVGTGIMPGAGGLQAILQGLR